VSKSAPGERLNNGASGAARKRAIKTPLTEHSTIFAVDSARGGNWFALNDSKHLYVVDVDNSNVADGTKILQWKWNDGDNQCWRFEQASS
jgi:hypothetical protein